MSRNILYTYRNREEFERLYDELSSQDHELYPFMYQETKTLIDENSDLTIDISLMVESVRVNRHDRFAAQYNLIGLDNDNRVVIQEELADLALNFFSLIFNTVEPLYERIENNTLPPAITERKILYTYKNAAQLDQIIDYTAQKNIPFFSFNQANKKHNSEMEELDNSFVPPIVDITTMIRAALSNNAHILFLSEQLIGLLSNTKFIVQENSAEDVLENLPLYFLKQESITSIHPELGIDDSSETHGHEVDLRKITDLTDYEMQEFCGFFSDNLIGHDEFKKRFFHTVKNFTKLNRIKEKKILSIFLLGNSGLGKTEVARLIKQYLNADTSLAKINFGNYSSQDSLNSLIGSPAGYVGCESGELGIKVQKSKAGVVVCDEFDKTTRPVYNFFLELLEEGSFTDSLTREYNLDGYIIIFTSNIPTADDFYKVLLPELQSRIDLVCEFKPLTDEDKKIYVDFQLNRYMERLSVEFEKHEVTDDTYRKLSNVSYKGTDNLRDIKRMIEQKVIEFLDV